MPQTVLPGKSGASSRYLKDRCALADFSENSNSRLLERGRPGNGRLSGSVSAFAFVNGECGTALVSEQSAQMHQVANVDSFRSERGGHDAGCRSSEFAVRSARQ